MTLYGPKVSLPSKPFVHKVFESHAARVPNRVAVTCGQQVRTYGDLNARANQLAERLRQSGVGRGALVGICLDRTPLLVESIMAVLKLGAAYVPLDPTHPGERVSAIISQIPDLALVVVSTETLAMYGDYIPNAWNASIADPSPARADAGECNPRVDIDARDLCYVVFTSGSTGNPKAVSVRHDGWYNLMNWQSAEYKLDERSSNLLVSALGFDISQRSIMTPLFCGATLHLLPSRSFDPALAHQLVEQLGVRTLHCTPSTLYLLVDRELDCNSSAMQRLDYVFIGGEALSAARIADWATLPSNNCTLLHQYGVSECTDVASSHVMSDFLAYAEGTVPAGKPIYNTDIHLLDEDLLDVDDGQPGEICISGVSVGAGYRNAGAADTARFTSIVRDGVEIGIYRTGDRGVAMGDGQLMVRGRTDSQVKVRGVRIDLGDVDTAIRQSDSVRDAATVAVRNEIGESDLIAFIIPVTGKFDPRVLRTEMLTRLPQAMVPMRLVQVASFPFNANGKVDRRALSAMALTTTPS